MANKKIGFIGVGMMGHGMAKNLAEKGFPTTVLGHKNRAPGRRPGQARREGSEGPVAELVKASEIIFICVTGSPQVEDLVYRKGGILESVAARARSWWTPRPASPARRCRIAADLKAKGVRFADAPLARTPVEAEQGRLNTMVGADEATFKEIEPALKAFCENIFHIGEVGAGHKIKLINNCAAIGQMTPDRGSADRLRQARRRSEEIFRAGVHRRGQFRHLPDAGRQGRRRRLHRHEVRPRQCAEGRALLQPDGHGIRRLRRHGGGHAADPDPGGEHGIRRTGAPGGLAGAGGGEDQQHAVPAEVSDRWPLRSSSTTTSPRPTATWRDARSARWRRSTAAPCNGSRSCWASSSRSRAACPCRARR